jgi:RecA-family ATPase
MPVTFDQIPVEPALYLSRRPPLPLEDVTLIFGPGAIGKGRMVASWIAAVTRGEPIGLDEEGGEPGDVITIATEDKPGRDFRPRLETAGADLTRVHNLTKLDGGGRFKLSATPRYPGHLAHLRGYLEEIAEDGGNPRMVYIDPVTKVIGWGNISTKPGANHLTETLQDFADDTGVAVVLVAHTTKDGKLEGSAGMMQGPRLVYRVSQDPSNDSLRVLSMEKANNEPQMDDLRFAIAADDTGRVRVEWLDRERLEQRRTERRRSWQDRLAARKAEKAAREAQAAADAMYDARCKVGADEFVLGSGLPLAEAQELCQANAGRDLAWKGLTATSGPASYTLRAG